jgi:hypothetical protein
MATTKNKKPDHKKDKKSDIAYSASRTIIRVLQAA